MGGSAHRACIVSVGERAVRVRRSQRPRVCCSSCSPNLGERQPFFFSFFFSPRCFSYAGGTQSHRQRLNSRSWHGRENNTAATLEPSVLSLLLLFASTPPPLRLCFYVSSHLHVMHWRSQTTSCLKEPVRRKGGPPRSHRHLTG